MYRGLYNWIIVERPKNNKEKLYDLSAKRFEEKVDGIVDIMLSKTLVLFYEMPFIISIIILIYNLMPKICIIINKGFKNYEIFDALVKNIELNKNVMIKKI